MNTRRGSFGRRTPSPVEKRSAPRVSTSHAAAFDTVTAYNVVTSVLDSSATGARIVVDTKLKPGSLIELKGMGASRLCEVRWSDGRTAGVSFNADTSSAPPES